MVNDSMSSKFRILSILRQRPSSIVSGQTLADELGISRVAVWKAVKSLQESGYGISSREKGPAAGYTLFHDVPDSLNPWEFGGLYRQFKHFKTTTSTMDEARNLSVQNSKISIITADEQTRGRGRLNHEWITEKDALSFTLITRPDAALGYYNRLCAVSQIALVRVFERLSGRQFFVRWPNDVWSKDGKAAGILTDVQGTGDMLSWVNLGIGINVSKKPSLAKSDAVFTARDGTHPYRKEILLEFLKEFKAMEEEVQLNPTSLIRLWNSSCPDIGKNMKVQGKTGSVVFNGINSWAWAQCEDSIIPPGDMRFEK